MKPETAPATTYTDTCTRCFRPNATNQDIMIEQRVQEPKNNGGLPVAARGGKSFAGKGGAQGK